MNSSRMTHGSPERPGQLYVNSFCNGGHVSDSSTSVRLLTLFYYSS